MKSILFIEDAPSFQKVLRTSLEDDHCKVLSALNGEEGVRIAKEEKPDLIVLDLILPKKSGLEVLKELKESPEVKEIPVLVLTNLESMEDIERSIELGAKMYLVKSHYSLQEIARKIRENVPE